MEHDPGEGGELAGFVYVYRAPRTERARTLLLLHGTGGDERDLIPIAQLIDADAAILSPRGQVLENGMPRFFRRLEAGVFDEADLDERASQLAEFVRRASTKYGFDPSRLVALGFSNGANIASAVMWGDSSPISNAILFRPMLPYRSREPRRMRGSSLLLSAGRTDSLIPAGETELLAERLRDAGADVALEWQEAGHGLAQGDITAARRWLGGSEAAQ